MPAPKRPNTEAATEASVASRQRKAQERKATELSAVGWLVASPEEIERIRSENWSPHMLAEWYTEKIDSIRDNLT